MECLAKVTQIDRLSLVRNPQAKLIIKCQACSLTSLRVYPVRGESLFEAVAEDIKNQCGGWSKALFSSPATDLFVAGFMSSFSDKLRAHKHQSPLSRRIVETMFKQD